MENVVVNSILYHLQERCDDVFRKILYSNLLWC